MIMMMKVVVVAVVGKGLAARTRNDGFLVDIINSIILNGMRDSSVIGLYYPTQKNIEPV